LVIVEVDDTRVMMGGVLPFFSSSSVAAINDGI
jgi:hypothetical protein